MNKIGALISIFCLTGGLAFATPMSGSISQDYDFGFETIIKRKFGEIVKMSKIFEKIRKMFFRRVKMLITFFRAVVLYIIVLIVVRCMGKREICV